MSRSPQGNQYDPRDQGDDRVVYSRNNQGGSDYPVKRSTAGGILSAIPPGLKLRVLIGVAIAAMSFIGYLSKSQVNTVTGKKQHISVSAEQEVALGMQSAPEMIQQMGGVSRDPNATALVQQVGRELVANLRLPEGTPDYPYKFHLLGDPKTVNAFALPGGMVFITEALLGRLENRAQLAGVLGHEVGHVVGRHSAERMAKAQLAQGIAGGVGVATTDGMGRSASGAIAQQVAGFMLLKYGREDELESDRLGVKFMAQAGYDPRELINVMRILEQASGGSRQPEFMATHPNPGNRAAEIQRAIDEFFPDKKVLDQLRKN